MTRWIIRLPVLLLVLTVHAEEPRPPAGRPAQIDLPDDPIGESQPPIPAPATPPPKLFVPSEKISADSAVSFPVDI